MQSSQIAGRAFVTFSIVILLISHTYAQLDTTWVRNWSATTDFQISPSGNVYVIGPAESPTNILTAKFNTNNNLDWQRQYDHQSRHLEDLPHCVLLDSYENVYVMGGVHDSSTLVDAIVIKYDPSGNLLWARTTDPGDSSNQFFGDAVCDSQGYVSIAQAAGDPGTWNVMFNCKLNPSGNIVWSDVDSTVNEVFYRMGQIATDRSQNVFIIGKLHTTGSWTLIKYAPGGSRAWQNSDLGSSATGKLYADNSGNVYTLFYTPGVINKIDQGGSLAWAETLEVTERYTMAIDPEQNIVVSGGTVTNSNGPYFTAKYDLDGNELWHCTHGGHILALDRKGNIYVQDNTGTLRLIDPEDGTLIWKNALAFGGAHKLDYRGNIYIRSTYRIAKYNQSKVLTIRDAHNDTIPNAMFQFIKISNPPFMDEDTLGAIMTDSLGRFFLKMVDLDTIVFEADSLNVTTDTLITGDKIKIARLVNTEPSVRHPNILGTKYSITLDNMQIDQDGAVSFNTIDDGNIVLNHTEYRYNLLVSVEWDAVEAYQQGLQEDFRQMSNYLYDVTDAQLRLDTVAMVDNGDLWDVAEVRILANNIHNPDAVVNAINHAGWYPITFPRKWFGNEDDCRWSSYENHPLDGAISEDYRAKAHEFGHFGLAFYDEYMFCDQAGQCSPVPDLHCQPPPAGNYGFMDYEYDDETGGVRASEMSSRYRYESGPCRNTEQFIMNDTSCWDQFEEWAEETIGGIYVPILRPDQDDTLEHLTPAGLDYIRGPNDNLAAPDYDIGAKIYFANPIMPPDPANRSLNLFVSDVPAGGSQVTLKKNLNGGGERIIEQGMTRDDGLIWVLGGSNGDNIQTYGRGYVIINRPLAVFEVGRQWLFGSLDVSQIVGDSGSIALQPITGDYPLVLVLGFGETPQALRFVYEQPFSQLPSVHFLSRSGWPISPLVVEENGGYNVFPPDSVASAGQARLEAIDSLGRPFFVPFSYISYDITDSAQLDKLLGPEAHAILSLSDQNSAIQKALIAATSYPPIMAGLDSNAVQAGDAYSISVSPNVTLMGANNITIMYNGEDLMAGDSLIGDETQLRIYRWNESGNAWQIVGGLVDTSRNEVISEISSLGTYALFTTRSPVGIEDQPENGPPYHFELSQNYPNPFNPVTVIEYSIPNRSHVLIEIFNIMGQNVRTLVTETKSAGSYQIEWNGTDETGKPVSTGIYLYRFRAGDVVQTKKMLLLK